MLDVRTKAILNQTLAGLLMALRGKLEIWTELSQKEQSAVCLLVDAFRRIMARE